MSRILLADDSPHAQRMGERILREEGFEVVSLTDGDNALLRMSDVDPDLILADVFLPNKSGLDICRYVKNHPSHRHAKIVLTAGLLEPFDEAEATDAGADAIIRKPFEASMVLRIIKPLLAEAQVTRELNAAMAPLQAFSERIAPLEPKTSPELKPPPKPKAALKPLASPEPPAASTIAPLAAAVAIVPAAVQATPPLQPVDAERVRAAVTVALDAALPALIHEITERVLIALGH